MLNYLSTFISVLFLFKGTRIDILSNIKICNEDLRTINMNVALGRGRTSAFGVYIGHRICHSMLATSATLLSRPDITMSEGPKDQTSRCPASKQVISCLMALK